MIQKLRGIVLHHINYGETSIILHLYTDQRGRLSVIIPGARGKRKNKRISIYHNLSILDLEVYYKESRELQQIKEAKPVIPLTGLVGDPIKSTIALFLAEVLYRCLKEEEANLDLFEFLENSIRYFEMADEGIANFHLFLLVHLTRFLGFSPMNNHQNAGNWFDLRSGSFTDNPPDPSSRLDPKTSSLLSKIMNSTPQEANSIPLNRALRNELLSGILNFYKLHLGEMGEIKSYAILKEIFDD